MAINSTDWGELENFVQRRLAAQLTYMPQDSVIILDEDMGVTAENLSAFGVKGPPAIVVSIEGSDMTMNTMENSMHPRNFEDVVEVAVYLYDVSLRNDRAGALEGLSADTRNPGIWKMRQDAMTALAGQNPTNVSGTALGWIGPEFTGGRRIAADKQKHIWRLAMNYLSYPTFSIDTSTLDDLDQINGTIWEHDKRDEDNPNIETELDLT